jgi:hypothetical protein
VTGGNDENGDAMIDALTFGAFLKGQALVFIVADGEGIGVSIVVHVVSLRCLHSA